MKRTEIENEARLARERGQGRFIPETSAQAEQAKAGRLALDADWPADVRYGDALIGANRYWRAAYEMRYHQRLAAERRPPVTVIGTGTQMNSATKRYSLSNGWFIDGATRSYARQYGDKYSVWEPGGDPSGCAGYRGGAPTLKLAVAVANGEQPCGLAYLGCRDLATGYEVVEVRGGGEGRVYRCDRHRKAAVAHA